jgi:predicted transcriptional regulator
MKTFYDDLKRYLSETGISQSELARRSGVSQHNLSKFLKGGRDMRISTASKLFPFVYGTSPPVPSPQPTITPPEDRP